MAKQRKQWAIPPSYDVGVQFYYRNILKGSDYVQKFIRESIAVCDRSLGHLYASMEAGQKVPSSEWAMSYNGFMDILTQAGLEPRIINQITHHVSHLAGGIGKDLDYLRVKEFLAYCGIEGIYDLENKKHFQVQPGGFQIPKTIVPHKYRSAPDCEDIRRDIAYMMDSEGVINDLSQKIKDLNALIYNDFIKINDKKLSSKQDIKKLKEEYFDTRPELKVMDSERLSLVEQRVIIIEQLKDLYAPLDDDFSLPPVGSDFDKDWYDQGEEIMSRQQPFRDKFHEYMDSKGKKKGDPEYDSFNWKQIRLRSFSIFDWAVRDFTMSSVNRGEIAEHRRRDVPKAFVQSVREEMKDGLLETLGLPYRIEAVADRPGAYAIICNDCVAEVFTLEQLKELEQKVAADEEEFEKTKPAPLPSSFSPAPPKPLPAPISDLEKAVMAAKQLEKLKEMSRRPDGTYPEISLTGENGEIIIPATPEEVEAFDRVLREKAEKHEDLVDPGKEESVPEEVEAPSPANSSRYDDELPFPEAGLGDDDKGSGEEKPKNEDKPALSFGDVTAPREDSGLPVPEKSNLSAKVERKQGYSDKKKASPSGDDDLSRKLRAEEQLRAMQGMYGNGMPGAGGHRTSSSPSIHVDLGMGALARRLGKARDYMKSARGTPVDPEIAIPNLEGKIKGISSLEQQLKSGLDSAGSPLSISDKLSRWGDLKNELVDLKREMKGASRINDDSVLDTLELAKKQIKKAADLARSSAHEEGEVGKIAKQVLKMAEQLAQMAGKLIATLGRLFNRAPSSP